MIKNKQKRRSKFEVIHRETELQKTTHSQAQTNITLAPCIHYSTTQKNEEFS